MQKNKLICRLLLIAFILIHLNVMAQQNAIQIKSIPFKMFWENTPQNYSLTDSSLTITAGAKTDMFRDPNAAYNTDNAPKLLFKPDKDFVLTASVEHSFSNKWDGGCYCFKTRQFELGEVLLRKRLYRCEKSG
jgi:hypothetical protein